MSDSSVLQHPVDEAPHQWSSPLYVILFHETVVEVGMELLGGHEVSPKSVVVDIAHYPVSGGLEMTMTPVRPTPVPGNRHHGMRRSPPHLLRSLQFVA